MIDNFKILSNLLRKQNPENADAIVWLQGDRFDRGRKVLELYELKLAKFIVVTGNNVLVGLGTRPGENDVSLKSLKSYLLKHNVKPRNIIVDNGSLNTKDQAIHIIKMAKKNGWNKLILVTSNYHTPRVYLTFLKTVKDLKYKGNFFVLPNVLKDNKFASGRMKKPKELVKEEKEKIQKYQSKGDVSLYEEGINYLKAKKLDKSKIKFRKASIKDANLLLKWRNDSQTRKSSHNIVVIRKEEHIGWLENSLKDYNRKIFIVESNGIPVGTIRTDNLDGVIELSWTVAPEVRGRGIGKEMVTLFVKKVKSPIKAEIKIENKASKLIAEYTGMKLYHKKNGILYYKKPAIILRKIS